MVAIWIVVALIMNVMDSVTTNLCLKQYPSPILKVETNPFMRRLMLKNRVLAEVVKQLGAVAIIIIYRNDIQAIKFMCIMLTLVVANNSFIVISRYITKRKVQSPLAALQNVIPYPEALTYPIAVGIIGVVSFSILKLIS